MVPASTTDMVSIVPVAVSFPISNDFETVLQQRYQCAGYRRGGLGTAGDGTPGRDAVCCLADQRGAAGGSPGCVVSTDRRDGSGREAQSPGGPAVSVRIPRARTSRLETAPTGRPRIRAASWWVFPWRSQSTTGPRNESGNSLSSRSSAGARIHRGSPRVRSRHGVHLLFARAPGSAGPCWP